MINPLYFANTNWDSKARTSEYQGQYIVNLYGSPAGSRTKVKTQNL